MNLQFGDLFENGNFLNGSKIKINIMNTIGNKYLSIIKIYFPYILDNIIGILKNSYII